MVPIVEIVRSNLPIVDVARYGAIGSALFQTHVVLPLLVLLDSSTPFAIAVSPAGTVTRKRYVALSLGVSFTGYHAGEPCGSPTTNAPSSVGTQPSIAWSGSVTTDGVPAVVDRDGEALPGGDAAPRRDHELLLAVACERRRAPVHEQPRDREAAQVEIEARQVLRRSRRDHGGRRELVAGRLPVERQVVARDVVAAVAGARVVRITAAGSPRCEVSRRSAARLRSSRSQRRPRPADASLLMSLPSSSGRRADSKSA